MSSRWENLLLGQKKELNDPNIFHSVSLIAFLAWVGLGADGLSSSAYGPEEAFRALGTHTYLAVALALATAGTVLIISASYSGIIEHFPFGGGGYAVTSRLLGERFGLVAGSALVVDYVLTIAVSVASSADQIFSFLPAGHADWKLPVEFTLIGLLVVLNLRGVKESVTILAPIFMTFLVTHAVVLLAAFLGRAGELPQVAHEVTTGFSEGLGTLGFVGMGSLFLKAYSLGGGTYTGIEAVSNGLALMREPKVLTAKKTMVYMAISLSLTAGGIVLAYLLVHAQPVEGKTMNAVLLESVAGDWSLFGIPIGRGFVIVTLVSEGCLLVVAALSGFLAGPRVMANMAHDSWLPHRFGSLSDRLTMQDGILLMGGASALTLLYTHGDIRVLVTMYSINVFLTFALSQGAMARYFWTRREKYADWKKKLGIQVLAMSVCAGILVVTVVEKFNDGGWVTVVVTTALVALCLVIRSHYVDVRANLKRLDEILEALPPAKDTKPLPLDPKQPTAAILVGGYSGLGVHLILTLQRIFPGYFKNLVFISVGVIDTANFTDHEEVSRVKERTEEALKKYVETCQGLGIPATWRAGLGTESLDAATELAIEVSKEFPRTVFFSGKLVFETEAWFQRALHNETGYAIQRRLQFAGQQAMVLPVRVLTERDPARS